MFKFFKEIRNIIISLCVIGLLVIGGYCICREAYKIGTKSVQGQINKQTIAILSLTNDNSDLNTQILTITGENNTLRILTQTQANELNNLQSVIASLNQSLTTLQNEKQATDIVVNNLNQDISYLNNYVAELEAELSSFTTQEYLVVLLPEELVTYKEFYTFRLGEYFFMCPKFTNTNNLNDSHLYAYNITTESFSLIESNIGNVFYDYLPTETNVVLFTSFYTCWLNTDDLILNKYSNYISNNLVVPLLRSKMIEDDLYFYYYTWLYKYNFELDIVEKISFSNIILSYVSFVNYDSLGSSYINTGLIDTGILLNCFESGVYSLRFFNFATQELDYICPGQAYSLSLHNNVLYFGVSSSCIYKYDFSTKTLTLISDNCDLIKIYIMPVYDENDSVLVYSYNSKVLYLYSANTEPTLILDSFKASRICILNDGVLFYFPSKFYFYEYSSLTLKVLSNYIKKDSSVENFNGFISIEKIDTGYLLLDLSYFYYVDNSFNVAYSIGSSFSSYLLYENYVIIVSKTNYVYVFNIDDYTYTSVSSKMLLGYTIELLEQLENGDIIFGAYKLENGIRINYEYKYLLDISELTFNPYSIDILV